MDDQGVRIPQEVILTRRDSLKGIITLFMATGCQAYIRTQNHQNTRLDCYRYIADQTAHPEQRGHCNTNAFK
jgi:hypothetical protein